MMWTRRRRALVCRRAVELVTDYLDGALSRPERARFEGHLAACPHCATYLEQIRRTIAALGRIEPDELAPEARDDLIELFRRYRAG
jgi:anti-sigma factor RsiW